MFVLIKSRTNLKMGHVRSKARLLGHILEKPCVCSRGHVYALEATFSIRLSRNLVRMFVLLKSRTMWKMGHVRLKTSSLGQILEKPYERSRGHIFSPIVMKLGQNDCLEKILDEF